MKIFVDSNLSCVILAENKVRSSDMIYVCQFTGTKRKWIGREGYVWNNGVWVRNNTSKKLIESLSYYKQQEK